MEANQHSIIEFYKYNGVGNDFVIIDNRSGCWDKIPDKTSVVNRLCHRRFGIGADGLIEVLDHPSLDFEMVYYNSDATLAFCGNGARCCVAFCKNMNIIKDMNTEFQAYDGTHKASVQDPNMIKLQMSDVKEILTYDSDNCFINSGCNHYVRLVQDVTSIDLLSISPRIRYDNRFAEIGGTNVNFVEIVKEDRIKVRTYEKGVETETLACGTGAVACAVAYIGHYKKYPVTGSGLECTVTVMCKGGNLVVTLTRSASGSFTDICLTGPVAFTFKGTVNLCDYL